MQAAHAAMSMCIALLSHARAMAFAPVFSAGVTSRRLAQQSAAVSSSRLNRCVVVLYDSNHAYCSFRWPCIAADIVAPRNGCY